MLPDSNGLLVSALIVLSGCGTHAGEAGNSAFERREVAGDAGKQKMSIQERFATLDEYLAHLELTQKPVDGPWYRKIESDLYELQTGNLRVLDPKDEPKRLFTRRELEVELGFTRP
jgi:hypothetical protein